MDSATVIHIWLGVAALVLTILSSALGVAWMVSARITALTVKVDAVQADARTTKEDVARMDRTLATLEGALNPGAHVVPIQIVKKG